MEDFNRKGLKGFTIWYISKHLYGKFQFLFINWIRQFLVVSRCVLHTITYACRLDWYIIEKCKVSTMQYYCNILINHWLGRLCFLCKCKYNCNLLWNSCTDGGDTFFLLLHPLMHRKQMSMLVTTTVCKNSKFFWTLRTLLCYFWQ